MLGTTPLVLLWKDENTARYVLDTPDGKSLSEEQSVTLQVSEDKKLLTLEGIVLGLMPDALADQPGFEAEKCVRLTIKSVDFDSEYPKVIGLKLTGPASRAVSVHVLHFAWFRSHISFSCSVFYRIRGAKYFSKHLFAKTFL